MSSFLDLSIANPMPLPVLTLLDPLRSTACVKWTTPFFSWLRWRHTPLAFFHIIDHTISNSGWLLVYSHCANAVFQTGGKSGGRRWPGSQGKEVGTPGAGLGVVGGQQQGIVLSIIALSSVMVSAWGVRAKIEGTVFKHSWDQEGSQLISTWVTWLQ